MRQMPVGADEKRCGLERVESDVVASKEDSTGCYSEADFIKMSGATILQNKEAGTSALIW